LIRYFYYHEFLNGLPRFWDSTNKSQFRPEYFYFLTYELVLFIIHNKINANSAHVPVFLNLGVLLIIISASISVSLALIFLNVILKLKFYSNGSYFMGFLKGKSQFVTSNI